MKKSGGCSCKQKANRHNKIKDLSIEDAVVFEALIDNSRIITNSKFFDINRLINIGMSKIEAIKAHQRERES